MKKSVFKQLIADNKRLRKEVHTLIAEPDSLSAMEIRIGHEIEKSIINGIMFGSYRKEVVREPLDQTKLDMFVEYGIKSSIIPYPINHTSHIFQNQERALTLALLKERMCTEDYLKLIELPEQVLKGVLSGSIKIECEKGGG